MVEVRWYVSPRLEERLEGSLSMFTGRNLRPVGSLRQNRASRSHVTLVYELRFTCQQPKDKPKYLVHKLTLFRCVACSVLCLTFLIRKCVCAVIFRRPPVCLSIIAVLFRDAVPFSVRGTSHDWHLDGYVFFFCWLICWFFFPLFKTSSFKSYNVVLSDLLYKTYLCANTNHEYTCE